MELGERCLRKALSWPHLLLQKFSHRNEIMSMEIFWNLGSGYTSLLAFLQSWQTCLAVPWLKCFSPCSLSHFLFCSSELPLLLCPPGDLWRLNETCSLRRELKPLWHQFFEKAVWQKPIWVGQAIVSGVSLHQWAMLQEVPCHRPHQGREKRTTRVVWALTRHKSFLSHRSQ